MRQHANNRIGIVIFLFIISVIWYFFPLGKEIFLRNIFAMRLALPAAILAVGGIGLLPGLISLGFVFCTIGDALGVAGSFEGQIGGFAVAQICFIWDFASDIRKKIKEDSQKRVAIRNGGATATILCLLPLIFAAYNIFPNVYPLAIRIGCVVYSLLLLGSVWTSIVRAYAIRRYVAMAGCVIFLVSDFTIAWNKFSEHIPNSGLYIMTTYYAALILIFLGTKTVSFRKYED